MRLFLGLSYEHSYLVANHQTFSIGHIYPQYHLVFDNFFEKIIIQLDNDSVIYGIFNDLFDFDRYWYVE